MTLGRKIRQWAHRLRRRVSKYLPVLVFVTLLGACANINLGNDTKTPITTTTTTTNQAMVFGDVTDMTGFMSYLGSRGYAYENEMEIADLQSGFVEGRRFQNKGMDYSVYRFDESNEQLTRAINEARTTNRMRMNVGGIDEEVPVFIAGNYLIQYPKDADITELRGHFQ